VSQPSGVILDGMNPMVFVEAVTKTAKQFRFVRRVQICTVGKTTFDKELYRPLPRCGPKR
jgi:hypothetical protein